MRPPAVALLVVTAIVAALGLMVDGADAQDASAFVRVTAICDEDGPTYRMRVRHESGVAPVDWTLQRAGTPFVSGTIGAGETQFVQVPDGVAGLRVVLDGVTNESRGTASTNTTPCDDPDPTTTTQATTTTLATTTTQATTTLPPTTVVTPTTDDTGGIDPAPTTVATTTPPATTPTTNPTTTPTTVLTPVTTGVEGVDPAPTTAPPSTSASTTSTTAPTTVTASPQGPAGGDTLPRTGSTTTTLTVVGLLAVAVGAALLVVSGRPELSAASRERSARGAGPGPTPAPPRRAARSHRRS